MPEIGPTVGWMFVVGFAATLVLTLAALACRLFNLKTIDDRYLKPLFAALILEMVGGVVFLFKAQYQEPRYCTEIPAENGQEKAWDCKSNLDEVYLVDSRGAPLPVDLKIELAERPVHVFKAAANDDFKEVSRGLLVEGEDEARELYVTATSQKTRFLGRLKLSEVEAAIEADARGEELSFRDHLHLGLYFAGCSKGAADDCERRSPSEAAAHLLAALAHPEGSDKDKQRAVVQLFYLRSHLPNCDDFVSLIQGIDAYRRGPQRSVERGDVFLTLIDSFPELPADQETLARKAALASFADFLAASVGSSDVIRKAEERTVELVGFVAPSRLAEIGSLLSERNRRGLEALGDEHRVDFACSA